LFSRRFTRATSACSARNFVIVEMPDTFVGVQLFIVSNLPLAVQLPYFNLIFIPPGRRNEMTLSRIAEGMTAEQRELYGKTFDTFAATLNKMQDSGLDSASAARRVIELAEQVPAPSRGAVGTDAEEILRLVHEKSDAEQDAMRLQMVGLK